MKSSKSLLQPFVQCSFMLTLLGTFVLALSSLGFAQTTVSTGSVAGTVTDASGAVVPGAKITIIGSTGQQVQTTTNGQGGYASGALVPGVYTLRIEAKGFKTAQVKLDVKVDTTANGSVQLQIGQEGTVVEVEASDVQVNTQQAEVQGVLEANQIENLPVNGRNFLDLAQLEPGVQIQDGANFDPTKVGYSSISFGGRFGRTARINVDGVDISDETVGTTTEDIPASSIQEFSLAQSSLDLSNDLTSSGAVNVTTKSGTNAFHGEAYGAFRDSAVGGAALPAPLNAAGTAPIAAPYQRSQEGGDFGGPIMKDKLFFFIDGERTFQQLAAPVAETGGLAPFSGTYSSPFKEGELMGRLDYSLGKTARLFGRFNYFQNSVFATFFPSSFQVYHNKDYTRNEVLGVDFNTGAVTHSIRFSYLKFQNQILDGTRGSDLPFANYPVSMNIGTFTVGPNLLAPQSTPQSDHQLKYDGTRVWGKHIVRFGASWNHIQGGGFASFFKIDPQVFGDTPFSGTDPTQDGIAEAIVGNGQGFSTTQAALGFPAGGLGPDNRTALYVGDTWKIRPNFTLSPGIRWERDTGRTDSDLGAVSCSGYNAPPNESCVDPNTAFPGWFNPIRQPNINFAPQLGLAWDPKSDGKTVIRAGIGLYYENVIYNNVLFDRPFRLQSGAFLATPPVCLGGGARPVAGFETITQFAGGTNVCGETIGAAASTIAAYETAYQAANPFSLTNANPNYIGAQLASGNNINTVNGQGLFAPNYRTPRAVQINFGFQHEIRRGMIFTADYLRNVETRALLNVDINHVGAARTFSVTGAQAAVAATIANCNASSLAVAISPGGCPGLHPASGSTPAGPATISDFAAFGLGTSLDVGQSCEVAYGYSCAFPGDNPQYGQMSFLQPISRSVYNALQMKLVENVANPLRYVKAVNFQIAYSLSRFVNPMASQGVAAPSAPVAVNDQDFVLQAGDNDNPLKYMGPSLLDRTHQISFGGNFDVPYGFRFGIIAHFYSPLSSPAIVGDTGTGGQIFQTDFTGSGSFSDPLPGTTNGSFMRDFGINGLNAAINKYNQSQGNQPTPAGVLLENSGVFGPPAQSLAIMQTIGAVAPTLQPAAPYQLTFPWLKATDFRLSWRHVFADRYAVEPNVGFYNVFNFTNSNLPPGVISGWLNEGAGSINSVATGTANSIPFRVGAGTGVFALGAPRAIEWGLKVSF